MKKTLLNAIMWLTGASKTLASYLIPILADSTAKMLTALLPIALDAVASMAADSGKSGAEKRAAAADQIKAAAVQADVQATSHAVNLAIEMALAKLQEAK